MQNKWFCRHRNFAEENGEIYDLGIWLFTIRRYTKLKT